MGTTRTEIVEHIQRAFARGAADRAGLLAAAERSQAPQPVLELLRRLPDRCHRSVRHLWTEAPEVPLGA